MRESRLLLAVLVACLLLTVAHADDGRSSIKSDETIEFFPTAARLTEDGRLWIVPIHGWIYEPESGDLLRRGAVSALRRTIGPSREGGDAKLFDQRVRRFLVDNEREKRVAIELAGATFVLPASAENGHFRDTLEIPAERAAQFSEGGQLTVRAALPPDDGRVLSGRVAMVGPEGVTVVSDIDDTVKVTEVTRPLRMMQRTFSEPFEPVTGLSTVYRAWANEGAHFHFVSGSPWQLQRPLEEMLNDAEFPRATYDLRALRFKDFSALEFTRDSSEFKTAAIVSLFAGWPGRTYVLIGDSGERDPEIYGELARRFPDRVLLIAIRDVTNQSAEAPRYREAFRGVKGAKWLVFRDAGELPTLAEVIARE